MNSRKLTSLLCIVTVISTTSIISAFGADLSDTITLSTEEDSIQNIDDVLNKDIVSQSEESDAILEENKVFQIADKET